MNTETNLDRLLKLLAFDHIYTAQGALIHALAVLLDDHSKTTQFEVNKSALIQQFDVAVSQAINAYTGKRWSLRSILPKWSPDKEQQIASELISFLRSIPYSDAFDFLVELTCQWILVTPTEIVLDHVKHTHDDNPFDLQEEEYLRWVMQKWLNTALYEVGS